jgi:CheY-like chemotaxis protein
MSVDLSKRVLVIEDVVDARAALSMLLRLWGHDVRAVGEGVAGLREALTWTPDAALLDIALPSLDGYEVARRIREVRGDLLLIAVTGFCRPQDRERALSAGFDVHLIKPVPAGFLYHLLNKPPQAVRAAAPLLRQSQELDDELRMVQCRFGQAPPGHGNDLKTFQIKFRGGGAVRVFERGPGLALFRAGEPPPEPAVLPNYLARAVRSWERSRPWLRVRCKMPVRRAAITEAICVHFESTWPV